MHINPRHLRAGLAGAFGALLAACVSTTATHAPPPSPATWSYPATSRGDVVDDYHGVKVPDPYRWFEDPTAQATKDWVTQQNALAQPYLEKLPQRAWLGERLKQLWTYERFGVPRREGGKYFYLRNDGTQDQSVLYVADSLDAPPRVLVDPNGSRDDATIALSQWEPSPDGQLVAYALSDGGTDWNTWHFRRVSDGVDLPVILKYSSGLSRGRATARACTTAAIHSSPTRHPMTPAATMPAVRMCISTRSWRRSPPTASSTR
jgi:prolyl oligopeptidase